MPSAADSIRAAIADPAVDGPGVLRFDRFMALALYGPGGFYTATGRAGRRGDFITSPEVGPLFGTVLARGLDLWWRELGSPGDLVLLEVGAGPGTLARSVLAAAPACIDSDPARYVAVESSDAQRLSHPDGIVSVPTLEDARAVVGGRPCLAVANELLDNVPFRVFVHDSGWREAHVVDDGAGGFAEVLLEPVDGVPAFLPRHAPHGARAPVQDGAGQLVRRVLEVPGVQRLLVIDYCAPATGLLVQRPWREWLRTYRGHERGRHYLRDPGEQDITVEVAIDQLTAAAGEPHAIRSQAQLLQLWGIGGLVEEGKAAWEAAAARPDLAAMRMRSRVSEAEALLDPSGLGAFTALEWRR